MFFNKKNKKLKEELETLTSLNDEYKVKCDRYQEKYISIKEEYNLALENHKREREEFQSNLEELESKLDSLEYTIANITSYNNTVIKDESDTIGKFSHFEKELCSLSEKINLLSNFLQEQVTFKKETSSYRNQLEENYNNHKK